DVANRSAILTLIVSVVFSSVVFSCFPASLFADDVALTYQEELKKAAPKVFIDCRRCDRDYIRTEITFVNYVRDRQDADVHVLITTQRTGSGGQEYAMDFIGQRDYSSIRHTLKYVSNRTDVRDEVRKGYVEVLKRGLFPFVMNSPIAEHISILFKEKLEPTAVEDKWNFWIFNVGLRGSVSGEESRSERSIRGNISANRVTPEMKLRMSVSGEFEEDTFDINGDTIVSTSSEKDIDGMYVKSFGDHWSAGGWTELESSTYSNYDLKFNLAPAIEYNFFPYYESTRRRLRVLYRLNYYYNNYIEETIYEKTSESLWGQSLDVTLEVKQPWGNATISVDGSHYFHDASKNRVSLWGHMSIRLVRGLNLDIFGSYSRIHDQLNLPKGDASLDEILLRRRELATDYDYRISIGLSYTFGSVYSNVVNPRFGR
ncbi:MAG: hypothetical protein GQ545_00885, partial [Candidatus Aminicenantes bacterium]|nr:hypothetical protein [Candidatus Aminicenantes bacterium]